MANFVLPYDTPENYTYDPEKIVVENGLAKLMGTGFNMDSLKNYWRLDETSWTRYVFDVVDSVGGETMATQSSNFQNQDGGIMGRCAYLDGSNDYMQTDTPAAPIFDHMAGAVNFWIKRDATDTDSYTRNIFYFNNGERCRLFLTNSDRKYYYQLGDKSIALYGHICTTDWHMMTMTWAYNSGTGFWEIWIYKNGIEIHYQSNATLNPFNIYYFRLGEASGNCFKGWVDEFSIWHRRILPQESVDLYNAGVGVDLTQGGFISDKPGIYKTAGDTDNLLNAFSGLTETLGGGNQGSVAYQLSDDGVTWKYWDGAAWSVAGSENYNTEATVNTNISTFPATAKKIYVKAILISDGEQRVELDTNQVNYTQNIIPIINAGTNKNCYDEQSISPFLDCSFSDSDGSVVKAEYKVDGEVDTWTEIVQGGYGTLLEAVQAWTYQFSNIGTQTVRLQITDDFGSTAEDSLTVDVSKYTVTFNVKDAITDAHLDEITFNPDDGSDPIIKDSPFTWDYSAGTFYPMFEKSLYVPKQEQIDISTIGQSYNFAIGQVLSAAQIGTIASAVWEESQADHTNEGTFGSLLDAKVSEAGGGESSGGGGGGGGTYVDFKLEDKDRKEIAKAVWEEKEDGTKIREIIGQIPDVGKKIEQAEKNITKKIEDIPTPEQQTDRTEEIKIEIQRNASSPINPKEILTGVAHLLENSEKRVQKEIKEVTPKLQGEVNKAMNLAIKLLESIAKRMNWIPNEGFFHRLFTKHKK